MSDGCMYKVVTFVPPEYLDAVVDALCAICVNTIGSYKNCMSWTGVTSTWESLESAHPFIGEPGQRSVESEYRLEFLCEKDRLHSAVDTIRSKHPYEEAEIDIYPLADIESL